MRRHAHALLLACGVFLSTAAACGADDGGAGDDDAPDAGPPPSPFVHAFGAGLYDGDNRPLELRGVNLGAWMFHETWISLFAVPLHGRIVLEADARGFGAEARAVITALGTSDGQDRADYLADAREGLTVAVGAADANAIIDAAAAAPDVWDDSEVPLYTLLETRFGMDGRRQVIEAFRDAWLTEDDLARIASYGLNTVRVPIGWRDLVVADSSLPASAPLEWDEQTFARLDELLDWCAAHGLYAVIDLQDSPGGHNDYAGHGTLYEDPAMQALTIELWREIGRRLRDRTEVAAYSLLAEPYAAPDVATMFAFYDRLHDALRADGDRHLLVIHDGFKGVINLPAPADQGWDNVIVSTHVFDWGVESLEDYRTLASLYEGQFSAAQARQMAPFFVGSFSTITDADYGYAALAEYLALWNRHDWSWAIWTYKRLDDPLDAELFGAAAAATGWGFLRTPAPGWVRPDPVRDDLPTLLGKMAGYASEGMGENARLVDTVKTAGAAR
jgi:aryl-phospho-beta-D-glucosidase BglC (GH1 family)